ncbi:pilus assembly protein TadG-related protein [Sphingomonas kaistensis]|uniref:Pilus assembly protein TadG-related protein n=1 Tax=Sphingomonas kaistensis TaxID=298708 RepID=A0ABZ2G673_9SPHN
MLRLLKKLRRNERGNVLILAGMAMPLIIGSAGLAVDTVQWALMKRQLQRAADSAALAGVYATVQGASQTAAQAVDYELNISGDNPNSRNATGLTLTAANRAVSYPAAAAWTNPVRVVLTHNQVPAFSSMFLPQLTISAGATAATIRTGVYCVVSLVNTSATGITATGNGDLNLGCGMITNSTSLTAAIATGSSEVHASPVAAVGAVPASTNWNGAELLPFTVKQNDPYAGISPPTVSPCKGNANKLDVANNGNVDRTTVDTAGSVVCVSDMQVNGTLKLQAATYYIDGGNFDLGSNANISCNGCTIILGNSDPSSTVIGRVTMNAQATTNMTAPTSGTYRGLLFYQDRRAVQTNNNANHINGTSTSTFSGAMYFPSTHLNINGNAGLKFTCAQFVSWTVEFSGNSGISNTINTSCDDGSDPNAILGRHVRLVA